MSSGIIRFSLLRRPHICALRDLYHPLRLPPDVPPCHVRSPRCVCQVQREEGLEILQSVCNRPPQTLIASMSTPRNLLTLEVWLSDPACWAKLWQKLGQRTLSGCDPATQVYFISLLHEKVALADKTVWDSLWNTGFFIVVSQLILEKDFCGYTKDELCGGDIDEIIVCMLSTSRFPWTYSRSPVPYACSGCCNCV